MSEQPIESAKTGALIVSEFIRAAGDDPRAREAAGNLGEAAVTITRTINNVLLPLAAVNFAFDKARLYFQGKFQQELGESTANIPEESLIEPKASIAGPTLQALAFTHEEDSLRNMFLGLLTTAMDSRKSDSAHPAFVEIIKQLDAAEASFLVEILNSASYSPIASVRKTSANGGHNVLFHHLADCKDPETQEAVHVGRFPAMIDNWVRLGLIEVHYDAWLTADDAYAWVEARPEYIQLKSSYHTDEEPVSFKKGYAGVTSLGREFANAINSRALA